MAWDAGAEAIRLLLDDRGLRPRNDFQAIPAVSDLLALDALKELQNRGIPVPGEAALSGFNDATESRLSTPPPISVSLPFAEQGARAVEMALACLRGEPVPEKVLLPSRLVVRQSCGCPSSAVVQAAAHTAAVEEMDFPAAMAAFRERALAEMAAALPDAGGTSAVWVHELLDAFQADLRAAPGTSLFLRASGRGSDSILLAGNDMSLARQSIEVAEDNAGGKE
jgi:hypothetical protein